MTRHHSNQDPRKPKSKEGSRRQSDRSQTASSSQRENRSGSSSSRTSTSQPSGSSSSSGRRHSSHRSSEEYSETYPRVGQYTVPAPMDFASMNAEQGSRGSYVDETRAGTVGYESWERRLDAERQPRVAFPHHRPRHSDHHDEIDRVNRAFGSQSRRDQQPIPTYSPDLDIDIDEDGNNQDNPQNYGGYGGHGGYGGYGGHGGYGGYGGGGWQ